MSPPSVDRELPCRPQVVHDGRQLVARALRAWRLSEERAEADPLDDVLVVVAELLGNATRSGAQTVLLRVDTQGQHVRVGVADDSPCCEIFRASPNARVTRLSNAIVASLSDSWGESFYDGELREVWSLVGLPVERTVSEWRDDS
jgi:hypothetical protein